MKQNMQPTSERRAFLHWDSPALPAAAALLADAYVHEDSLDLGNALIAFPGARAARRLKELLVAEATRRALRLIPPQVTTLGTLPERLYTPDAPLATPAMSARIWLRQLRAAAPEDLELLFPHAPAHDDLRGWLHLAGTVQRLQETVAAAGRRFVDAAACCDDSLLYDDSNRWHALARLQDRCRSELEGIGRADRDLARIDAVERGEVGCDHDLWLIGVAELPAILRSMLSQLIRTRPERVRILVHAPSSVADRFDGLGCVIPRAWADADIPLGDDQLSIVGHPSNQAVEAARALAALGGAYAADEIVIGVPDAEVVPYIEQQLASAGVRARYAAGQPVERTSAYRLLAVIADVLHDGSFDAVAALARHAAFGDWLRAHRWDVRHDGAAAFRERDGWLLQLDRFLAERLPVSLEHELAGAEGRGRKVVEALRTALTSDALLGRLAGRRTLSAWMPHILELLLEIYGDGPRSRDVPVERHLIGAAQAFRDAALAHTRVPAELDEECDAATAIRVLLDDVRGAALPPEADEAAVELLGWLELHLDDAPVAVLTGMNEPFVPGAINADAFLPNTLRSRLGIIDNDVRHARDAYQLTAMLHSRRVHAIAGRRSMLGDPQRPSRLLLAASGEALAQRILTFLGGEETEPCVARSAEAPGATSAFVLPPHATISLETVPESFRVTEFRDILADPYAWALARVMGDETVDDGARELDPLRFGSMAHAVLERFGRSEVASSDDEQRIARFLDNALDDYVAEELGRALPAVRLQVEQLRLRLRTFARRQAAWIADGWRTVGIECSTPKETGAPFDVDGARVWLRGRIDRVDYHAGRDEWMLFDYKTSERAATPEEAHRNRNGWIDLQLPLYRAILPHTLDCDGNTVFTETPGERVGVGYIVLCGEPAEIAFHPAHWTDVDVDDAVEAAREAVRIVRRNRFEFVDITNSWLSDDMAAVLGKGRLVREDDAVEEEIAS